MTLVFDPIREVGDTGLHRQSATTRLTFDVALEALIARGDERLLADAGLTLEAAMGAERYFWARWSRLREPWAL